MSEPNNCIIIWKQGDEWKAREIYRSSIKNMDKKVSREFIKRWQEELAAMYEGLSEYSWNNFITTMINELGHEVEEEAR
jgi:hypothetical protein